MLVFVVLHSSACNFIYSKGTCPGYLDAGPSEELDFHLLHCAKEEVARQMLSVLSGQYVTLAE